MYVQRVLHSDRDSRTDTSTIKLTAVSGHSVSVTLKPLPLAELDERKKNKKLYYDTFCFLKYCRVSFKIFRNFND